jgi:hypothetical protein
VHFQRWRNWIGGEEEMPEADSNTALYAPGAGPTTRHLALQPSPLTHWFFKADEAMTVRELDDGLQLESNPLLGPFVGALYVEGGEPGETWTPAAIVKHTEDEMVFAVLISARDYIERALMFAEPTEPI